MGAYREATAESKAIRDTPLTILLMEDDPGDADFLRETLSGEKHFSFDLICEERLSTGLARLAEGGIDVILLDLALPDSQGLASFAKVYGQAPNVPIVVLTGLDDDELAIESVRGGAQDYLVKEQVNSSLLLRSLCYAIARKRAEEQITASLAEKEVLLKEIHHRVRNNLQVISSLLGLQGRYIKDEQAVEMFKESQNRVKSIALIHERLYQSKDLAKIDFTGYIRNLVTHLFHCYGASSEVIDLNITADSVFLGVDKAIPCGLLINELVSNSLKHAFPPGMEGEIRIDLRRDANKKITLIVSDTGVGIPKNVDFDTIPSLGLKLVKTLTNQLGGALEIANTGGTEVKISFAESEHSGEGTP